LGLLPFVDFLILNELEADCITQRQSQDATSYWADFFGNASPETYIIVTRGAQGAVVLQRGHVLAAQSAATVQVVDPTGAGDAFAAGFVYGLWKSRLKPIAQSDGDWPKEAIEQGLYWGCIVASCSVLTRGASVPSAPEQIREFLATTASL